MQEVKETDKIFYNSEVVAEFPLGSCRVQRGDQIMLKINEEIESYEVESTMTQMSLETHVYIK